MDLQEARKRIGKKLIGHTNGDAMASMHRMGVRYMANRGVSVPQLKEIASEFEASHELAEWLWNRGDFREMRILAFMLEEPEKVTRAQAYAWVRELTTMELATQAALNLFVHLPFIKEEAPRWLHDEEPMVQATAFVSLATLAQQKEGIAVEYLQERLQHLDADHLMEQMHELADDSARRMMLRKAISRFLRALARKDPSLRMQVKQSIGQWQHSGQEDLAWIADEVGYEIIYLEEWQE